MRVIDLKTKTEYDIIVERSGENLQVCPKCSEDRKKSKIKCFSYNLERGIGHCSHCDLSVVEKKEFTPSRKEYKIPEWNNVTNLPDKVVNWFKERGIGQQTLIDLKISSQEEYMPQVGANRNCILFPYFRNGEIVNVKYRDGQKNFKLSSGAELIFFNLDSIKGEKSIIITEGEIDCLTYVENGFKATVSVPNGAAKGNLKLEYLDNCWQDFEDAEIIYLATDDDEAGRRLQDELARRLGVERCRKVEYFGYKDVNELAKSDVSLVSKTIKEAKDFPIDGVYTANDIRDEIWKLYENGLSRGATVGIREIDELISFELGYMTAITGVPSHGKSSVLDQFLLGLNVNSGWKGAFYSPENWPLQVHYSRIASKFYGKWFKQMSREENIYCMDYFSNNFYFIMPENAHTVDSLLETVRQLIKKHGINYFVIDAWNKMEHKYTSSETQYISETLDKFDFFCKRNKVHLFLVAHPTKMKKNEKDKDDVFNVPTLYDISGSANFYNKMANGISVYKRKISDDTYINEIYVQKVKFEHWGKEGMAILNYDKYNGGRFTGNVSSSAPMIPMPTYIQSSIEVPPVQSQKVEFNPESYGKSMPTNTSFLNSVKDTVDDDDLPTFDNEEAPF